MPSPVVTPPASGAPGRLEGDARRLDGGAAPTRRDFLKQVAATAAVAAGPEFAPGAAPRPRAAPAPSTTEAAVKALYDSLTDGQKKEVCFDWDYRATPVFGRTPVPDPS